MGESRYDGRQPRPAHSVDMSSTAARSSADVLFLPEPGQCGGRLDPHQQLVPSWLADLVDWHVRPSASPWASATMARTTCPHIDWAMVWSTDQQLFTGRAQVGIPPPPDLWAAQQVLADLGYDLALEVQFETVDDRLALAIYGAGTLGRLTDRAWAAAAPLLTTCCSTVREPRPDAWHDCLLPPRPVTAHGRRRLPAGLIPRDWLAGDWLHTWWSYPLADNPRSGCTCTGHRPIEPFGPSGTPP